MTRIISLGAVLWLFSVIVMGAPAQAADSNANIVRWAKGTVEYRKLPANTVSGSEEWTLTVHPDGSRTLNTTNRVDADGTQRTVVMRVASDFRPLDLFASFWYRGAWVGTGYFNVTPGHLDAVVSTPQGRFTQQAAVADKFAFIPHPISTNAWQVWGYDRAVGGVQDLPVYDMQTRLTGPGNVFGSQYTVPTEYVGKETMKTPAGTFVVDHYRHPTTDIYVTGPDAILVRFTWKAAGWDYVLKTLEQGP